jgi:hypothetical protein
MEGDLLFNLSERGPLAAPFRDCSASPRGKKIRWRRIFKNMQKGKLRIKKKLDWVRIAFILNQVNGLTLDKINFILAGMFNQGKISKSNREIASIINSYQSRGFEH